ncbi:transporter substrate-binding domain-containing protein [Agarivorans sp. B2Z047]|uniref:substrate-binding periplasmic protein n=1 Tax=Agarivorans sp. B2Z047 TaxID=2652721 RepID=UPI00128D3304|nr:transporter substrate-binding domain-containing protein [Agarivorans sp. B2Z047]MPW30204.1 transporter substrate-binding domain-containing protein [Agarivorans sp. B2Z047]UQN43166.1 transporter substrate-binding domain-containing protein [Agarivorans sp. B2Z047]
MPMLRRGLMLLVIFTLVTGANAASLVVRHVQPESDKDQRHQYFIELLELALSKTETSHGSYTTQTCAVRMMQDRALQQVQRKRCIDIVWTMTSLERESKLLAVRIPLLKGLLGQRVLMIRREDLRRFKDIQQLSELAQMRAGQGMGWPDIEILEYNRLPVIEGKTYEGLFGMLERGRFDYFPRGISEIGAELKQHQREGFVAEPRILLSYPAPIYYFVNPENTALAERLEKGLRLAIDDGSFDALFRKFNYHKLADLMENRLVFKLRNPSLHPKTPIDEDKLWVLPNLVKNLR